MNVLHAFVGSSYVSTIKDVHRFLYFMYLYITTTHSLVRVVETEGYYYTTEKYFAQRRSNMFINCAKFCRGNCINYQLMICLEIFLFNINVKDYSSNSISIFDNRNPNTDQSFNQYIQMSVRLGKTPPI